MQSRAVGFVLIVVAVMSLSATVDCQDASDGPALLKRGLELKGKGEFEAAVRVLGRAASLLEKGDDVGAEAHAWQGIAECQEALHRYEPACTARRRVVSLRRKQYGSQDRDEVPSALNALGESLLRLGQAQTALTQFEAALRIRRRLHPGVHADVAIGFNNVAVCLKHLGQTQKALPQFASALRMWKRLYPGDHRNVATGINNTAACLESLGQARKALPRYEAALAMRKRLFRGDHGEVADSLNNVALCLCTLGRARKALPLHEAALAMWKRLHPGDSPSVALGLNNLGECLESLGQVQRALPPFEAALTMWKRLFPGDHPYVAVTLNNLAGCLEALGQEEKALPKYEAALAMKKRLFSGDHPGIARSLNDLAACLKYLGHTQRALLQLEAALAMRRRLFQGDHPDLPESLNNLGTCFRFLGHAQKALPLHEAALAMCKRLYPGDHPEIARGLGHVADCVESIGDAQKALPQHEAALAMLKRLYPRSHPHVARGLNAVASCLQSLGQTDKALQKFEAALAMARRVSSPHVFASATNVAYALYRVGQKERARGLLREAVAAIERRRSEARGLVRTDRAIFFQHLKRYGTHELAIRAEVDLGAPRRAFDYLERARGRLVLDLLHASAVDPLDEVQRQARLRGDQEPAADVDALRSQLALKKFATDQALHAIAKASGASRERRAELTVALHKANEDYKDVLRERARVVRDHVPMAGPIDVAKMQGLLGADEAVLAFQLNEDDGFAFFVPSAGGAVEVMQIATGVKAASELVQRYGLEGSGRGKTPRRRVSSSMAAGHELFRSLVPTALWQKIKSKRRVYVLPHGPLHRLPFEALVTRKATKTEAPTYWIDEGPEVVYATSGSMIEWTRKRRDAKRPELPVAIAALGDPVFGGKVDEVLPPEKGCLITRVQQGSQAATVGLRVRDVLLRYGAFELKDTAALRDAKHKTQVAIEEGKQTNAIKAEVWRQGKTFEVLLKPGALGVFTAPKPAREAWQLGYGLSLDEEHQQFELRRDGMVERYHNLKRLPGTREEVLAIYRTFTGKDYDAANPDPRVAVLLGERATETELRAIAPKARILHLASHHIADTSEARTLSALALTLPKNPSRDDDGFLKLSDLLDEWRDKLPACELVVLSACSTNRGEPWRDDGVYALPWGFLFAGVPSVVASLWNVSDKSTAELMSDFYERLRKGEGDRSTALTAAKKELKKRYPHPRHWAAFVWIGDPR